MTRANGWERAASGIEKGPISAAWKIGGLLLVIGIIFGFFGWVGGWFTVLKEETNPRTVLNRYEWFKNTSASLDAKLATLSKYKKRRENLRNDYKDENGKFLPRSKWVREDREQWNTWQQEEVGVAASYNNLSAKYNAAMAKINWAYTNQGELPAGATKVLPREYKPYLED